MNARLATLGDRYPFQFEAGAAFLSAPNNWTWLYLALLGLTRPSPWSHVANLHPPTLGEKVFERISEQCLGAFFGPHTQTLNFGWPSESGRPVEFDLAIAWLAERVGLPVGNFHRQPRRKDGGVDIVVWRTMPDRRPGVPLLLVQATVQADFVSKARDIDRRLWAGWLSMDVEPIVCLTVPAAVSERLQWEEISRSALLLDRMRLVSLSDPDESLSTICRTTWEGCLADVRSVIDF